MNRREEPLQPPLREPEDRLVELLRAGPLTLVGRIPWSSNFTLLGYIEDGSEQVAVVYKPNRGERPLWDFPHGTLARREVAAYLVSRALRWNLVPPTVLRRGPHGLGSVQLFADADQEAHFFTFQHDPAFRRVLQALVLFDVVCNNADRKAGHCLAIGPGRIVAIDQGLCFHVEPKLRTVIWDFAGQRIPADLRGDLHGLEQALSDEDSPLVAGLMELLSPDEVAGTRRRLAELLKAGRFPDPPEERRAYPWPLV
jgi:uncharacterized repeat protein (TIGR03843 family)